MGYYAVIINLKDGNHPDYPKPGSFVAGRKGCTCSPVENNYGEGLWKGRSGDPVYYIDEDCPIHKEGKQDGT